MIGQAVKHGRSMKDARNLSAHLLKDKGARIEMLNSAASTIDDAMSDMMIMRDASRAKDAFLHLSISPSRDMSHDELRKVANIVTRHFNADEHQAVLVFHEKDRANGQGNRHVHLVLGKVGPEGGVIPAGFEKIRLETAMRISEFEMGEPATLGRHHASSIKWLRENGREDVARWLDLAHGPNPEKPQSPASPSKRQMIQRKAGTDLTTVTMTVRSAWDRSDNPQAFAAALSESGFEVAPGQKAGVFIVSKNGVEVGALDRLLKEKRRTVADRMEGFNNDRTEENNPRRSDISRSTSEPKRSSGTSTIVEAIRNTGANGGRSGSPDFGRLTADNSQPKTSDDAIERFRRQGRRFEQNQTIKQIEQHTNGWDRLRELRDDFVNFIRDFVTSRKSEPQFSARDHEIAAIFSKACYFSAENMDRLEKLDPGLSAFREQYGEKCRGLSHEKILENLEDWRDQGRQIIDMSMMDNDDDDHDYNPPSMKF